MQFSSPRRNFRAPKKACLYMEEDRDSDQEIISNNFYCDTRAYKAHLRSLESFVKVSAFSS